MEPFTGLRMGRFQYLLRVVRERGGEGSGKGRGRGRPWCLALPERVLLVAVYNRTNLTMRQLAPLLGICPGAMCRIMQRLGPLLALEPARRPAEATERLWTVDGTLIPVRDREVGASSRNYRFSANVQVIIDADTRLVMATGRPAPGNKADAHVWRDCGLPALCEGVTTLADGAPTSYRSGRSAPNTGRKSSAAGPVELARFGGHLISGEPRFPE
ncbi:transposase family protein [Nonomuraea sp. NPDC047529]|uniref:helix-turn-helix domain-containing protein n=1 Tax=Nonomuraea sp. NPDC047529 TaxID=3155623 RepID=UPI0033D9E9AC